MRRSHSNSSTRGLSCGMASGSLCERSKARSLSNDTSTNVFEWLRRQQRWEQRRVRFGGVSFNGEEMDVCCTQSDEVQGTNQADVYVRERARTVDACELYLLASTALLSKAQQMDDFDFVEADRYSGTTSSTTVDDSDMEGCFIATEGFVLRTILSSPSHSEDRIRVPVH